MTISEKDFICPCGCGRGKVDPALIEGLNKLQSETGIDFIITSGARCEKRNAADGGAKASFHLTTDAQPCRAADIQNVKDESTETAKRLFFAAIKIFKGVGLYKGLKFPFLHVDTRTIPAFWYRGVKYNYFKNPETCWGEFKKFYEVKK